MTPVLLIAAVCTGISGPAGAQGDQFLDPVTDLNPAVIVTPGLDVPNPWIVENGGRFYMFSSQTTYGSPNIALRVSASLTSWGATDSEVLPEPPGWAAEAFTWSPDVRKVKDRYVLWFNSSIHEFLSPTIECIGEATSRHISGPYIPVQQPLVCQQDHHGSIDPRSFVDPKGRLWLYWKSDDNADVSGTEHSFIFVQRLSSNGLRLVGKRVAILTADQPWEGRIVESPDMVSAAGHYWLFYSGNWFNEPYYAIGVAECATPIGPCLQPLSGPWLASNDQGNGPGEVSLFHDTQGWWALYAPYAYDYQTYTPRPVALAHIGFNQSGPFVIPYGLLRGGGGRVGWILVSSHKTPVKSPPKGFLGGIPPLLSRVFSDYRRLLPG